MFPAGNKQTQDGNTINIPIPQTNTRAGLLQVNTEPFLEVKHLLNSYNCSFCSKFSLKKNMAQNIRSFERPQINYKPHYHVYTQEVVAKYRLQLSEKYYIYHILIYDYMIFHHFC